MEEQIERSAQIQSADSPSEQPAVEATGVQTLRGIACVLVVAVHVVGWSPTTGMHVGEGTFYRNLVDLFAPLRMPLFTFLSGFVYAYFPVMTGRVAPFATKPCAIMRPMPREPPVTRTTLPSTEKRSFMLMAIS